jgi:hypothetical protein
MKLSSSSTWYLDFRGPADKATSIYYAVINRSASSGGGNDDAHAGTAHASDRSDPG